MTPEQAVRDAVADALENEYDEDEIMGWAEDEVYLTWRRNVVLSAEGRNPDGEPGGEG